MTRVQQPQGLLNFLEDAYTIIRNSHFRSDRSLSYIDHDHFPFRMINGIVKHLGKAVMPNVRNVVRKFPKHGKNVISPNYIFSEAAIYPVMVRPFRDWANSVGLAFCFA